MLQSNTCIYTLSSSGQHDISVVNIIMSVLFRCACRHLALVSMSIVQGYYSLVTFAENESFFFFW